MEVLGEKCTWIAPVSRFISHSPHYSPTMFSTISNHSPALISGGNSTLELAQLESFMEHLRKFSGEQEKSDSSKTDETDRNQRNSLERKSKLHNTLLETLSEENELDRREQLDSRDAKKMLDQKDLDNIQISQLMDRELDRVQDDSKAASDSAQSRGAVDAILAGDSNALGRSMLGISQTAVLGNAVSRFSSEGIANLSHGETHAPIFGTGKTVPFSPQPSGGSEFSPGNQGGNSSGSHFSSPDTNPAKDATGSHFAVAQNTSGNPQGTPNPTLQSPVFHPAENPGLDLNPNPVENSGKGMQILAAFSEVSGRIANVFQNSTTKSPFAQKSQARENPLSLKETPSNSAGKPKSLSSAAAPSLNSLLGFGRNEDLDSENFKEIFGGSEDDSSRSAAEIGKSHLQDPFSKNRPENTENFPGTNTGNTETPKNGDSQSRKTGGGISLPSSLVSGGSGEKPVPSFVSVLDGLLSPRSSKPAPMKEERGERPSENISSQIQQGQRDSHFLHAVAQGGNAIRDREESGLSPAKSKNHTKKSDADSPSMSTMERVRFVQRIANACQSASNRNGNLRMKLHPEALGSLSVNIRTLGKSMKIKLESETQAAKSLLLENLDQLKTRLQAQGMEIESFEVSVRENGF